MCVSAFFCVKKEYIHSYRHLEGFSYHITGKGGKG